MVRWPVVTAVGDSLVNSSVLRLPGGNERKPSEFELLHVAVVCLTNAVPRLVSLVSSRAVYLSVDLSFCEMKNGASIIDYRSTGTAYFVCF